MIRSVKHKGLRVLVRKGDSSKLLSGHLPRIERVLKALNVANIPQDMDLPGFDLHPLSGKLKGHWSVSVSGNYRIIFRMEDGDTYDVNLVDYH